MYIIPYFLSFIRVSLLYNTYCPVPTWRIAKPMSRDILLEDVVNTIINRSDVECRCRIVTSEEEGAQITILGRHLVTVTSKFNFPRDASGNTGVDPKISNQGLLLTFISNAQDSAASASSLSFDCKHRL